jgi:hypothetical protein
MVEQKHLQPLELQMNANTFPNKDAAGPMFRTGLLLIQFEPEHCHRTFCLWQPSHPEDI